jgi:N-acetylmuramic acid 6-phosphate etherase
VSASRWSKLLTEGRLPRSRRLDVLATERAVALLLDEDRRALQATARHAGALARAARAVATTLESGGDVVFVGAGTSGRLGVLEAAECPPTFGISPRRIRAVIAGGPRAVTRSIEGAEDRADEGHRQGARLRPGDLLVALSASGVTPFARGALTGARLRGAGTVLITCGRPRGLAGVADVVIALATGPEVLTGSTRLKAGSATKAALNAITTAAMARLGKVYENWMVDLRQSSAKLQDRAHRIVASAGGVSAPLARRLLAEAEGEVKTALVMARLGLSAPEARRRLARVGGHVRAALRDGRPSTRRRRP